MNKYIRTKDIDCLITTSDQKEFIKDEYIIKEDDDIEKLLDCAIEVTKDNKIIKWDYIESCKLYHQEESTIYGAIWIIGKNNEPILKSVAKMTDGTWELLVL